MWTAVPRPRDSVTCVRDRLRKNRESVRVLVRWVGRRSLLAVVSECGSCCDDERMYRRLKVLCEAPLGDKNQPDTPGALSDCSFMSLSDRRCCSCAYVPLGATSPGTSGLWCENSWTNHVHPTVLQLPPRWSSPHRSPPPTHTHNPHDSVPRFCRGACSLCVKTE